jgi:hypothetical protein
MERGLFFHLAEGLNPFSSEVEATNVRRDESILYRDSWISRHPFVGHGQIAIFFPVFARV